MQLLFNLKNMKKIFAIAWVFLLSVSSTFACSCAVSSDPTAVLNNTEIVFIWRPIDIETISSLFGIDENKITFVVDYNVKWNNSDSITIFTAKESATCWYDFEIWREYIVYANTYDNNDTIQVSLCSRTNLVENASEDLEAFNIDTSILPNNELGSALVWATAYNEGELGSALVWAEAYNEVWSDLVWAEAYGDVWQSNTKNIVIWVVVVFVAILLIGVWFGVGRK